MLTFTGSKQLEGDVRSFTFKSDKPTKWVAGQYMHLTIKHDGADDRGDNRWFTISSAPSDGEMTISTRIVSENPSTFKRALAALKPGDSVEAEAPEGDFILGDISDNYIFVAGGIGITPFHSIIREAASRHSMPRVTLLYANRTTNIAFENEFEEISKENPNLKIEYVLSPDRIDKQRLQKTIQNIDKPKVYVSGPEPMVEAFAKDLADLGLGEKEIKADYFPGYPAF